MSQNTKGNKYKRAKSTKSDQRQFYLGSGDDATDPEEYSGQNLLNRRGTYDEPHLKVQDRSSSSFDIRKPAKKNIPRKVNYMTDTEGFVNARDKASYKRKNSEAHVQEKSVYIRSKKGFNYPLPPESSLEDHQWGVKGIYGHKHNHNKSEMSMGPNKKKKKIKKLLCEIVPPEMKERLVLRTGSAARFFDDEDEKKLVKEVIAGAFKLKPGKDYFNRLYGYTLREFLDSVHNPHRINAMKKIWDEDPCVPKNHFCCGLISLGHKHEGNNGLWQTIYIAHDNKLYLIFNTIVSANCLISSYYYASLVGFRYSAGGEIDVNYKLPTLIFESLFAIHMISQFLLEFKVPGEKVPINDPFKIWKNYLNNTFPLDFICLIPMQFINMKRNRQLLFFMIKMLRLIKGFDLFDVHVMMTFIKQWFHKRTQDIVDNDREKANDVDADNTGIGQILTIQYLLKTFKLIIVILNTSYLTGIAFLVLCEGVDDFIYDVKFGEIYEYSEQDQPGFLTEYDFQHQTTARNLLISLYFAFTSLSTVGFGDYAPRGNIERFFGAFMLLFGVAIFSYIMGNFIDILSQSQSYSASLDDGDNLTKFFGIIQSFNYDKQLEEGLKKRIEAHFDYRWEHDKLQAFRDDADLSIFNQLPEEVRKMMFTEFLFKDFLYSYRKTFSSFPNMENINQNSFYTWSDFHYRRFMESFLYHLEPRREEKGVIIHDELDEVNEAIFIEIGTIDVGFEINRKQNFVMRLAQDVQIGSYNITFDKRSKYIFKTSTVCMGFSIRRINWKSVIMDPDFEMITTPLKKQIKKEYDEIFAKRVRKEKNKMITKWGFRKDYDAMLRVVDKDEREDGGGDDKSRDVQLPALEESSVSQEMDESDDQDKIAHNIHEYIHVNNQIFNSYDDLYHEHIKLKSNHRRVIYENDKLRLQIQMLMAERNISDKGLIPKEPEDLGVIRRIKSFVSRTNKEFAEDKDEDFVIDDDVNPLGKLKTMQELNRRATPTPQDRKQR